MALTFKLSDFGHTFATRERGAELRELLARRSAGHDGVVIDFDQITNVSYSFADEFLAKLCAEATVPVHRVNVGEHVEQIVRRAIERRGACAVA